MEGLAQLDRLREKVSHVVFAKKKELQLQERMKELGIKEEDLVEKFVSGSGKGGQKLHKTSSCVYLKHIPTGIEVKCGREREQALNRFFARRELCDRFAKVVYGEKGKKEREREKRKKQKRRRRRRSQIKQSRID